jgi:hypothetical protein
MAVRTRTFAAAAALLALALTGCNGTEPGSAPTVQTPNGAPTESPPQSEEPSAEPSDEPTADVAFEDPATIAQAEPGAGSLLSVTDVRAASHETFDRVVFDLDGQGGPPGWRVEYVDEALDDGSGLPVDVAGDATLQVRISGTGMPMDTGVEEYGGDPVTLTAGAVQQVVYRFVFEGYTTAFVGVDEPRPFRVFTLTNPTRLVVDVLHADG